MITSIITGIVAGLGIETVGLWGSASVASRFLRLAPTVLRLAKAVRSAQATTDLHSDADTVIRELEGR